MKIAYFDTIAGVSGDMTLAAFIDAGVPVDALAKIASSLDLPGVELEVGRCVRNGISAVKLDVVVSQQKHYHRHLADILGMIGESDLPPAVKETAGAIFTEVARAEAKVHDTTVEKIHFHEVGAIDSIVDIVGAAVCLDHLKIGRVYSSPVRLGSGGFIDAAHGRLPLPGPAAAEILKNYPTVLTDIPYELTTPTGAAIIKALSGGVLSAERMRVERIGYGAGSRELKEVPNLLRIMVGEIEAAGEGDDAELLETNIDDMNPELYPYIMEKALAEGALDVWLTPVIMKKGRPGIVLSVLAPKERMAALMRLVMAETTTLGVRIQPVTRKKAGRESVEVSTSFGKVLGKKINFEGEERIAVEFEEGKRIAMEQKIPLVEVYRRLNAEFSSKSRKNR
ncbi:MAG TPA: nickel pincer cofactor biosynthesis protein LarC [Bacteroidota bacterium]|nr:nickel pincer cofactor biosynthesis protein LarC [Bacteroidota bacterium]